MTADCRSAFKIASAHRKQNWKVAASLCAGAAESFEPFAVFGASGSSLFFSK
jgi:hypothetical protein